MNAKEYKKYLKDLKSLTDKLLKSKKASQAFYISAGIHTPKGKLKKPYTTPSKIFNN